MKTLTLIFLLALGGCSTIDYRDRPWDPKGGGQLFEQIPNWDRESVRVPCGRVDRKC
jgi:hypothetical protein